VAWTAPAGEGFSVEAGGNVPTLSENPQSLLNLPDITDVPKPSFLRLDRFRLLDLIIERCNANIQGHVRKEVH